MLPSATPEPTNDEAGEAADAVAGVCGLAAAIVEPAGVFDARAARVGHDGGQMRRKGALGGEVHFFLFFFFFLMSWTRRKK